MRNRVWTPAIKASGLGFPVRMHDLRHTHASWLLAGGADLSAVMERLGHRQVATTQNYPHAPPTPTVERWTPSPGSGNAPLDPAKSRRRHWMSVKGASVRYGHRAPASRPGGARVAARRPSGHLVTSRGAGPTVGFRTGVSAGERVAGLGDGFSARVHVEAGVHDLAFQRCGRSALRPSPLPAPGAPPPPRSTRQGRTAPPAATGRRSIRHWSVRPSPSDAGHRGSSSGCVGTLTQPRSGPSSRWDRTGSHVQDSPMLVPYGHGHHERERGAGAAG